MGHSLGHCSRLGHVETVVAVNKPKQFELLCQTWQILARRHGKALILHFCSRLECFSDQDEPAKPTPKKQKISTTEKSGAKLTPSKKAIAEKAAKPSRKASAKVPATKQAAKGKGNGTSKNSKKLQRITSDSEESESQESDSEFSEQEVCYCK